MAFEPLNTTLSVLREIPTKERKHQVTAFLNDHPYEAGDTKVTVTPWTCEIVTSIKV